MNAQDLDLPAARLEVVRVPCLSDNYGWILRCPDTGATALVDTPEVAPLEAALAARGWTPDLILNTHHHPDHVGGNEHFQSRWSCRTLGPEADRARIPGLQRGLEDGDRIQVGERWARVLFTPGHTRGHIVYHFEEDGLLFCGDTLFALGCGRLFEGTPAQMWRSLSRIRELPDETLVCCAHEYTLANARFAATVEAGNEALGERTEAIQRARAAGEPTVPFSLGLDKATNPFLRADVPAVKAAVDLDEARPHEVFGEVRRRKDGFRG